MPPGEIANRFSSEFASRSEHPTPMRNPLSAQPLASTPARTSAGRSDCRQARREGSVANRRFWGLGLAAASLVLSGVPASAQHLWWNLEGQRDATCLYGEITVLATHPAIYYCGANWHPGEPAGGYCGIQHNSEQEKRTIFSIWDTSPTLHPKVTAADPQTLHGRFGGEGEGGHTHMLWPWKTGETFQFFVQKVPGSQPDTTDARYYVFDRAAGTWRHSATITSPNGGKSSVATVGGGINSFLENFLGRDRDVPKLALYRLWLGPGVDKLKCLTQAKGDGHWGQLHDAYYLAEGSPAALEKLFPSLAAQYGAAVEGGKGATLKPITDQPVPAKVLTALKNLPHAAKTAE
jgi:hypothetical protein